MLLFYGLLLFFPLLWLCDAKRKEDMGPATVKPVVSKSKARSQHRRMGNAASQEEKDNDVYYSGEPDSLPTEPPDSIYYGGTIEYYTDNSSETYQTFAPLDSDAEVYQHGPKASKKIPSPDPYYYVKDHEDSLTREAWAALPNQRELYADRDNVTWHWQYMLWWFESAKYNRFYMAHLSDHYWFGRVCYQLATTFLHARKDLKEYYRIRYAYYNKRDFEIGYIVHEITYKYMATLEIFHNVQSKFFNRSRFANVATSSYMVFMYGVIVDLTSHIIHLCNILGELDTKYGSSVNEEPEYYDEEYEYNKKMAMGAGGPNYDNIQSERERQRLRRKRLRRERRKQLKAMKKSGVYSSTKRTRRPRSFDHFPRHYGWSIEYW